MKSQQILPVNKRELASNEKLLEALNAAESEIKEILSSPYYKVFLCMKKKADEWSEELNSKKLSIFDDDTNDAYLRTQKFFTEMGDMVKNMDTLKKLMSPEELEKVDSVLNHATNPRKEAR